MAFEKLPPRWEAAGVQPTEEKMTSGWLPREKVPAPWLNWYFNGVYESLKELQEKAVTSSEVGEVVGVKFYKDISELGLTAGSETIESIVNAMANNSELNFIKVTGNTSDIYPEKAGILHVKKLANYRTELEFTAGGNDGSIRKWQAYYDINITPNFTGWQQVTNAQNVIYPNLVKNSSAALGLQNWTNTTSSLGSWLTSQVDHTVGSMFFTSVTGSNSVAHCLDSDPIMVVPGGTYHLQAMFNTYNITEGHVYIEVYNSEKTKIIDQLFGDLNKGWHRKEKVISIPSDVSYVIIRLVVNNTNSGKKHFSRIKLCRSSFDVPFSNESDVYAVNEMNDNLSSYASGKDSNGTYTTVQWKRKDGTLYKSSVLSSLSGDVYKVQTIKWYDGSGINVIKTEIYDLTYDEDGFLISEVKR